MSPHPAIARTLQRYPAIAAVTYGALLIACIATSWLSIAHLLEQRASLTTATQFLTQLHQRWSAARRDSRATNTPSGSPFIAGGTLTVAGSKLLQRVSGAISGAGGRILSSQVNLDAARHQPGFISVLVNCELDQPGLQKALYNLEAGMPFLFVRRLEVHVPDESGHAKVSRMHVLVSVSGQWRAKP